MEKINKTFTLLFVLISLLLLIYSAIPLAGILERDPPSIFNLGSGGTSRYMLSLMWSKGLEIIFSLTELNRFRPDLYALLVIGLDQMPSNAEVVANWVRDGGIVVILDEFNYSLSILPEVNIGGGSIIYSIDIANCSIHNTNMMILVNVFRTISRYGKGDVLCVYNDMPIAISLNYGKGRFIVVRDSSLVINEIYDKLPYWYNINSLFIYMVSENRKIIIYEGARQYSIIGSQILAYIISVICNGLSSILLFPLESCLTWRLIFILLLSVLPMFYSLYVFGLPKSIDRIISKPKVRHDIIKNIYDELKEDIAKGINLWSKIQREK